MSIIKVKNTSPKVIGLGALQVLQGDTVELPAGFGLEHPTVKWLIKRGWLTKVSAGGVQLPPGVNSGNTTPPASPQGDTTPAGDYTPPVESGDGDTHDNGGIPDGDDTNNETAANNAVENVNNASAGTLSRSSLERLKIENLREIATQRGITFEQNATKAVLIDLITAKPENNPGGQE